MLILYIDDDPDDVELFCEAVQIINPTCRCATAPNGREGLTLMRILNPDLIFLDINMPVMDGHETLKEIYQDNYFRDFKIYVLSTTVNPRDTMMYRALGASDCLVKPNSFSELTELLRRVLEKSHD